MKIRASEYQRSVRAANRVHSSFRPAGSAATVGNRCRSTRTVGYAYIPFIESTETYRGDPLGKWKFKPDGIDDSVSFMMGEVKGGILAWDPVRQREVWRHYLPSGVAGGTVTTAGGLVFQGTGSGYLIAYDARNGKELWRANADNGVMGGPISYELDGHQFVAVMAGISGAVANMGADKEQRYNWRYGQGRRLLVFKLNGTAKLPPRPQELSNASAAARPQADGKCAARSRFTFVSQQLCSVSWRRSRR